MLCWSCLELTPTCSYLGDGSSNLSHNTSLNKDLTNFDKQNPKCPSDTSLNPDIKRNFEKV